MTLTPTSALAFGTVYTARVDPLVRATDGTGLGTAFSWSFTTVSAVAPTVTRTVPANAATNVNTGVVLKADFSKAMNASTLNTTTFKLTGPSGAITGTVAYNASLQEATFTPGCRPRPGRLHRNPRGNGRGDRHDNARDGVHLDVHRSRGAGAAHGHGRLACGLGHGSRPGCHGECRVQP